MPLRPREKERTFPGYDIVPGCGAAPIRARLRPLLFFTSFLLVQTSFSAFADAGVEAPAAFSLLSSRSGIVPGGTVELALVVDVAPGYHLVRAGPGMQGFELSLSSAGPVEFSRPLYPPGETARPDFLDGPVELYSGRVTVRASASIDSGAAPGTVDISARVAFQACGDDVCSPPSAETLTLRLPVVPAGAPVEELNGDVFGVGLQEGKGAGRSYTGWMVTAFLWGIGGCLTPCIYPMIAITIGFFGGQVKGRPRLVLLLAVAYVLGIAVTYSVLGVTAALSGRILGSALQHPAVIIGFSLLLAVLSLSMFGLYDLRAPSFLTRSAGGKAGVIGAFVMGLLVAVLALPCLGPVTIGLMVYVQKLASAAAGFFVFLSFSLGLGTPFVFLALFSGSLERLPRSGVWLLWVRKLLGFLLLGLSLYYLGALLPEGVERLLFGLLGLAAAATLYFSGRRARSGRIFPLVRAAASAAALLFAVYTALPRAADGGPEWLEYGEAALEGAMEGKEPSIVLFTAEWCPPCQKLKTVTFRSPEVLRALEGVVPMKADLTGRPSPAVEEAVEKYGIKGVPTIVFLDASGKEVREARTVGYVGPRELVTVLGAVRSL